jgi:ligand-binding sensor domain-containing protein
VGVLGVAPDGAIWVNVERGVARFDPAAAAGGAGGSAPTGAWAVYTVDDGLSIPRVGAVAFGPDGGIWFDATRFQPDDAAGGSPLP